MQLYIIRHGQSTNNVKSDLKQYVVDPLLTDAGQQQAERLAQYLAVEDYGVTHLYCSALRRALQTAKPVAAALGLPAEVWVDIHESGGVGFRRDGKFINTPGMTRVEILEQFPGFVLPDEITDSGWWRREEGFEPFEECYKRGRKIAAALHKRSSENPDDRIVMVSHGIFVDGLIKIILNKEDDLYYYVLNNASITCIDFDSDAPPVLRYVNHIEHLPPDLHT